MRIFASLLAIALAVCFSISQTGCSPKKDDGKTTTTTTAASATFEAEATTATLDKKGKEVTIAFKKGEPDSAESTGTDKALVKAEIKDKKLVLTQPDESPAEDKSVKVVVKGGKDKKEEITVTVTVKKKAS